LSTYWYRVNYTEETSSRCIEHAGAVTNLTTKHIPTDRGISPGSHRPGSLGLSMETGCAGRHGIALLSGFEGFDSGREGRKGGQPEWDFG
jgi:hypothetical protein